MSEPTTIPGSLREYLAEGGDVSRLPHQLFESTHVLARDYILFGPEYVAGKGGDYSTGVIPTSAMKRLAERNGEEWTPELAQRANFASRTFEAVHGYVLELADDPALMDLFLAQIPAETRQVIDALVRDYRQPFALSVAHRDAFRCMVTGDASLTGLAVVLSSEMGEEVGFLFEDEDGVTINPAAVVDAFDAARLGVIAPRDEFDGYDPEGCPMFARDDLDALEQAALGRLTKEEALKADDLTSGFNVEDADAWLAVVDVMRLVLLRLKRRAGYHVPRDEGIARWRAELVDHLTSNPGVLATLSEWMGVDIDPAGWTADQMGAAGLYRAGIITTKHEVAGEAMGS